MKNTIITTMKHFKKIRGNSLAEFATTTALMATLAATAAPKLSELSEGAKAEKTFEHIDKIIKQAGNFYQKTADWEGRGRFPGQHKFNHSVGGPDGYYENSDASSAGIAEAHNRSLQHHNVIMSDLGLRDEDGWRTFNHPTNNEWMSVFGEADWNYHQVNGNGVNIHSDHYAMEEWLSLFGWEPLNSPYQDGHYVYTVVAGGGSGDDVFPPVMYVVDIENAVHYNNVLTP
tara:strand:+ start:231 stop:920 length:690 start_codon:yes stop_codon:yes gene_type:complete